MINYENMDDLTHLSRKEKLKIVKKEIDKILCINELLLNALKYNEDDSYNYSYIYASFLKDEISLPIMRDSIFSISCFSTLLHIPF